MKKVVAAVVMALAAQAQAGSLPERKVLCPIVGKMAEAVAEGAETMSPDELQEGVEEIYKASLHDARTTEDVRKASTMFVLHSRVVAFVVQDKLDVYSAKKAIVLRCQQGAFDEE